MDKRKPRQIRWRIVLLAWPCVYGLIYLAGFIVHLIIPDASEPVTIGISSFFICSTMIYAVVPLISKHFKNFITKT